jgi:anti-anti-sigma factor
MDPMEHFSDVVHVQQAGKLIVLAFAQHDIPGYERVVDCRDAIVNLIEEHHCEVIAFDLTGVPFLPSGILGLLVSLRRLGVQVHLYNPSDHIRKVLRVTKLDEDIKIRERKEG